LKEFLIFLLKIYQAHFSFLFRGACIFTPSCSQYSIEAIEKYGLFKGIMLSVKRFFKCRYPNKGGFDPIE
jgi:putative membrane protein insertion efficiency factor